MKDLYKTLKDEDVLTGVISEISKTSKSLVLVHNENDDNKVAPNREYLDMLDNLTEKEINITRYYYGNKENFEKEKSLCPNIKYVWRSLDGFYQRAIIIDEERIFFKVGNQFCYSEYLPLVKVISDYLKNG